MSLKRPCVSRRSFVAGGVAAAAMLGLGPILAGCAGQSESGSANGGSTPRTGGPAIAINDSMEELKLVLLDKDVRAACVIVAMARGYYADEKLNIGTPQVVVGGYAEAMPLLSDGAVDVLPFGVIPTCKYISRGDNLVIFGGTAMNGSEALALAQSAGKFKKADDFKGAIVACLDAEVGHMAMKSWLQAQGLKITENPEEVADGNADVAFVQMESLSDAVAAVEKGEADMCFADDGQGYQLVQGGKLAVAFRPHELIGGDLPCCCQSTNRATFENKKSALVKFEMATIRAMNDIDNDREGAVRDIMAYSGMPEDSVTATVYGLNDYVSPLRFEVDPHTNDVLNFYDSMVDSGEMDNTDKGLIAAHLDSRIYKSALDALVARGDNADFYSSLLDAYEQNNEIGV